MLDFWLQALLCVPMIDEHAFNAETDITLTIENETGLIWLDIIVLLKEGL